MNGKMSEPICIGLHQIELPRGAKASITSTYSGLRDQDKGHARWDAVRSSLQARADAARASGQPRSDRASELYRAAGANPDTVFSSSRLVGFDANDNTAIIAEHQDVSAAFAIEAHRVQDGRYFVFEGKSSQASRYPAVRDGILDATSRYRPKAASEIPPDDAFCTAYGSFRVKGANDVSGDVQLVATFPEFPGVFFSLNIYGLVEPSKEAAFEQRAARDLDDLVQQGGNVRRLHAGRREYGGQTGDLVAVSISHSTAGVSSDYKYFWQAEGRVKDAYMPEVEAELMTDDAYGVDQAILDSLWSSLMGSFRLRRTAR